MTKNSYHHVLKLISAIFNHSISDNEIKTKLEKFNGWDELVQIASDHLVLTTVYCRLNQRQLLKYLPTDLAEYLSEITQINRNRNNELIAEAKLLGNILEKEKINYVFIKGISLLLKGCYRDIGERMIGDIDLLVNSCDLNKSFDLLTNAGYTESIEFSYKVKNFRHAPRQIKKNSLAAVEIHDKILVHGWNNLLNLQKIIDEAIKINQCKVPENNYLHPINIYTTQINNHNHYYNRINFKNLYDSISISNSLFHINQLEPNRNKYLKSYLRLYNYWLNDGVITENLRDIKIRKIMYRIKCKFKILAKFDYTLKFIILQVKIRIKEFIKNKDYRNHIFKNKLFVKSS